MHRFPSLLSRHLSRREHSGHSSAVGSAVQLQQAAHALSAPIHTLDAIMCNKLAVACRRSSTLAASRAAGLPSSLTAAHAHPPSSVSRLSPLTPRVTPLPSPRVTPLHSRKSSFSYSTVAASSGRASPASAPASSVRRVSPIGLVSRVIAPFTPLRFVSSRSSGSSERERETKVREKESTSNAPLYGSRPATSHPPDLVHSRGVPVGQTGAEQSTDTAASRVIANAGLSDFLGRVYSTTGWSVVGSLAASYGLATLLSPAMLMPAMIGGFVVSLGSIFALNSMKPETTRKAISGPDSNKLVTVNSSARQGVYALFIGGNALTLVPLVTVMSALHPLIIPASAGIAGLVMAGSSLFAYRRPSGSLVSWQGPLMGALLAAIGVQLGAAVALWAVGPNLFSSLAFTAYPYLSIGLFSALTAVDTHSAIAEYEKGEADHLGHAVGFYLNFINLLVSIARIISDFLPKD